MKKMKTKEQMLKEGYPEDVFTECSDCGSFDCIIYPDYIVCFDCKTRKKKNVQN